LHGVFFLLPSMCTKVNSYRFAAAIRPGRAVASDGPPVGAILRMLHSRSSGLTPTD